MTLHQPEYDFVFRGGAMRCLNCNNEFRQVTITPSFEHPGYWFVEQIVDRILESSNRPMRADAVSYFLKSWGFPADQSAWEATSDERTPPPPHKPRDQLRNVVYFISAGAFIKIGFTAGTLQSRIDGLKTGCPYKITPLATLSGDQNTERQLHSRFAHHRANLEWFHASEEILNFIRYHAHGC